MHRVTRHAQFRGRIVSFRALIAATLAVSLLSFVQDSSLAAGATRINFEPGQTSAHVEGRIAQDGAPVYFLLRARAGQHMRVRITPMTQGLITAGIVIFPSGRRDGGPGGLIFDYDLTETGEYMIRVTRRQNKVAGAFRLEVQLSSAKNRFAYRTYVRLTVPAIDKCEGDHSEHRASEVACRARRAHVANLERTWSGGVPS
jgi:hypothetical protein